MTRLDRPNILMVVFDSLSEQTCRTLNADLPSLSAMQDSGVRFSNAYAPSPEGGPARASLFTGLDMAAHGVWTDGVALPARHRTLPQRLAECGYKTWLVGRRQLAGVSHWTTEHARPSEYAQVEWAHGPLHRSRQNAYLAWLQQTAPAPYSAIFPGQPNPDDTDIPDWQRSAMAALPDALCFNHWVGSRVCAHLSQHTGEQPFLGVAGLVVGATMGAAPNQDSPCESLDQPALRQADAALGAIIQCLQSQGMAENTVVVVTSARGSVSDMGRPMQESAIKVPLIVRTPGCEARTAASAVSTIDIAPTVCDLARISSPLRMQGTSLLTGQAETAARGWALARLRNPDYGWHTAFRKGRWKLIMTHGRPDLGVAPEYSLFDLQDDPDESRDLADSKAHQPELDDLIDLMIDARVAFEDRTEPRIAKF